MTTVHRDILQVTGAKLAYEIRGAGPVLLLLAGGSGGANSFNSIANELASHFTVIAFDRRGYARSPLALPMRDGEIIPIETQSEDAACLLAALSPEPARVFGSSLGAVIGLDLAIRHPDLLSIMVAHEPPLPQLMSPETQPRIRLGTPGPEKPEEKIARFAASIGVRRSEFASDVDGKEDGGWRQHNTVFFLAHEANAVGLYRLDFERLRTLPCRVVFAGGEAGKAYFPYLCAEGAAAVMGRPLALLPGNHAGYGQYPNEFAGKLRDLLTPHEDGAPAA